MIDFFRTWLPQIIGYAEAVQDGTLEKAWVDGDRSQTSAYYSGELDQQIFGDLDADNMLGESALKLESHPTVIATLDGFLCSLKRLHEWIEAHVDTDNWAQGEQTPVSVHGIFQSEPWRAAQSTAAALILASQQAGFSSKDFDPR